MKIKEFEERLESLECQQINAKINMTNIERAYIPIHEEFLKTLSLLKGDRLVFVERQDDTNVWFYLVFHGLAFYTYFGRLNCVDESRSRE